MSNTESVLSQFKLGIEYNERDYEVLRQAASERRRQQRDLIRSNIAMYFAGILSQLKFKK